MPGGLKDTVTAESAYQLALGNFDRAAAIVQAISGASLPPEIEVIRSSRGTDLELHAAIRHSVRYWHLRRPDNPWPTVPMTPRARLGSPTQPWMAAWLAIRTRFAARVAALDKQRLVLLDAAGNPIQGVVSLADLGIQPFDLIAILRGTPEPQSFSELESRLRFAFARPARLPTTSGPHRLRRKRFARSLSPFVCRDPAPPRRDQARHRRSEADDRPRYSDDIETYRRRSAKTWTRSNSPTFEIETDRSCELSLTAKSRTSLSSADSGGAVPQPPI